MVSIPARHRWLFWDVEVDALDPVRHADYILPRVLEHGGWVDVRWLIQFYGVERIHRFLRDVGHPELSARTLCFWRTLLKAENEPWAVQPAWRTNSNVPWNA